jgi:hypothetical protein
MRHRARPIQPAYKTISYAALLRRNIPRYVPLFKAAALHRGLTDDVFAVLFAESLCALDKVLLAAASFEALNLSGVAGLTRVFVGDGEAGYGEAADFVVPGEVAWRTFGEVA